MEFVKGRADRSQSLEFVAWEIPAVRLVRCAKTS